MKSDYTFFQFSALDYEGMVIIIKYKENDLVFMDEDQGLENQTIKIFAPPDNDECWFLNLKEFEEALQKARKLLIRIRRPEDSENAEREDESDEKK
jgi:hypothetical protein